MNGGETNGHVTRGFDFRVESTGGAGLARAGTIETPHGDIKTPAFIPVATKAAVKALTPEAARAVGAQALLANTYHLYLQPGAPVVEHSGGLSEFMHWNGPTFTDSGGFQVFSLGAAFGRRLSKFGGGREEQAGKEPVPIHSNILKNIGMNRDEGVARLAKVDDDGVTFRSHLDGSTHRFTPERSIELQQSIGADIIFAFDECPSPVASHEYQTSAMKRTHAWAARCLKRHRELQATRSKLKGKTPAPQALFGIIQGGRFEDLRRESAKVIGAMELARTDGGEGGFDGFGIGGSFEKQDMGNAVRWVNEILPPDKPRHLLGIGEPTDMLTAIENGCDTFDCVGPTRMGRTGTLYTKQGKINIGNARFAQDFTPLEEGCDCYACKNFTRGYLHHLFDAKEMLAATLASIHNLRFIIRLVDGAREAILGGAFQDFKKRFLERYVP